MSNQNICNICGANYEYINGRWKCPACGAYKEEELSNEEVTLLYNAAQKLRLADFDDAERLYTDIIEKYTRNHSGYWGRLLSKYGIKYEEDFDGRKIPTCYATSIESVISDKDYLKAIQYADADTKAYYQKQAEYIERVRKEWVEKASKEEPYDIFICYKDSDLANDIDRTHDSIEAQDLYIHLTAQGYRVFYSRESLRDKVGEKYEPYIFNALCTAKVMLVYGTSAEYITSTWLKNEWTRYEKRISLGEKLSNSLLVICDGFSPTELPKALSSMQCFDAKRKTFYTDLDRCVKQIVSSSPVEVNYNSKEVSKTQSPLHEHRYKTSIVKSTCIAKGYTVHKCNCGYEYKDTYTPLVDHSFKTTQEVAPTCISNGYQEKLCEICGEKENVVLPALGHKFSKWIETKHPTCTEAGEEERKCFRCDEKETRPIAQLKHTFSNTTGRNNSGADYCIHCGRSMTEVDELNNTSRLNVVEKAEQRTIDFMDILKNWWHFHKSFYTSETTRMQKVTHFLALIFSWSFIIGPTTEDIAPVLSTICFGFAAVSVFVGLFALPILVNEMQKYKKQEIPYPKHKNVRLIPRIFAYFLIFIALVGGLDSSTPEQVNDAYNTFMVFIVCIWALVATLHAYCPKQYKHVRLFKYSKPISKAALSLIVIFVSIILMVIAGSISS